MNKIPVWIDLDTGVDDAIALICACKLDNIEIVGVSAGCGTTTLENTFRNTRNILNMLNRKDIKVFPGANKPWINDLIPAPAYHGINGIGEVILEDSDAIIEEEYAWDMLYKAALKYNNELIVVAVGQMTNLANALVKYPNINKHIKQINIMGGAIDGGNMTPCGEANIVRDPQAAQCVFKSGIEEERINNLPDNEICNFIKQATKIALNTSKGSKHEGRYVLHDICPIIYLKHPEYFTLKRAGVYVETMGGISYGKTVSDLYTKSDYLFENKNVDIGIDINREEFIDYVVSLLV